MARLTGRNFLNQFFLLNLVKFGELRETPCSGGRFDGVCARMLRDFAAAYFDLYDHGHDGKPRSDNKPQDDLFGRQ